MDGFYSREELEQMGFRHLGKDVQLSKKASFYGTGKMSFGDHVRVDDFCVFVGNITLGSYIHVAAYTGLHASMGSITMGDFSTFSSRCTVYAASDDYSGETMTNSVIPEKYKNTICSDICIGKNVIIGTNTVLIPGAEVADGVAIGAMSMVNCDLEEWSIYGGIPARKIRKRKRQLLEREREFLLSVADRI